jgi:hypothetical protein
MKLLRQRDVTEALSECIREMEVRKRCYDRWIADAKMTLTEAQDRFDRLASAIEFLTTLEMHDRAAAVTRDARARDQANAGTPTAE